MRCVVDVTFELDDAVKEVTSFVNPFGRCSLCDAGRGPAMAGHPSGRPADNQAMLAPECTKYVEYAFLGRKSPGRDHGP